MISVSDKINKRRLCCLDGSMNTDWANKKGTWVLYIDEIVGDYTNSKVRQKVGVIVRNVVKTKTNFLAIDLDSGLRE